MQKWEFHFHIRANIQEPQVEVSLLTFRKQPEIVRRLNFDDEDGRYV